MTKVHAIEQFCHDRESSIATNLDSDRKKKEKQKRPPEIKASQLGIRA